jgi:hypothetical protein
LSLGLDLIYPAGSRRRYRGEGGEATSGGAGCIGNWDDGNGDFRRINTDRVAGSRQIVSPGGFGSQRFNNRNAGARVIPRPDFFASRNRRIAAAAVAPFSKMNGYT